MQPRNSSIPAELFFGAVYGLGLSAAIWTVAGSDALRQPDTLVFVGLGALMGLGRVRLARSVRISLAYPFVLASLILFGLGAAVLTASLGAILSGAMHARRSHRSFLRFTAFRLGAVALTVAGAGLGYLALGGTTGAAPTRSLVMPLVAYAFIYAVIDLVLTLVAVRLSTSLRAMGSGWKAVARSLTWLTCGSLAATAVVLAYRSPILRFWLLAIPVGYLVFLAGRLRAEQRVQRRRRKQGSGAIYRSITQAMARALIARDAAMGPHLDRVQELCLRAGASLGLSAREMDALAAAALLHDVGKIAVPERILLKPGRLSRREARRVRVHPQVGADIVSAIGYPYAVEPIVKHHHERWDGRGYPDRLMGDEIPLSARVLAVVDCYDALTSDRPYRKALTRQEAIVFLRRESGAMFDPSIVELIVELLETETLPGRVVADPDLEPDADVEDDERPTPVHPGVVENTLYAMNEIADLSTSNLALDERLTLTAAKVRKLIGFESLVVYRIDPERQRLNARFADGHASEELGSLSLPTGERLSGWCVAEQRAVIGCDHQTPIERDGFRSDLEGLADETRRRLGSALAAPLVVNGSSVGALTIYDRPQRRFTPADRRTLVAVAGHVARALEFGAPIEHPAWANLTDPLTGLPNARFLRMETHYRLTISERRGAFALLAFHVRGREDLSQRDGLAPANRLLIAAARRLARACTPGETLVRFGEDQFLVLTPLRESNDWTNRWDALRRAAGPDPSHLRAAHVRYPEDGVTLDDLLNKLNDRLELARDQGRAVLPFRAARSAG